MPMFWLDSVALNWPWLACGWFQDGACGLLTSLVCFEEHIWDTSALQDWLWCERCFSGPSKPWMGQDR